MRNGEMLPPGDPDTIDGVVEAYKVSAQGNSTDYLLCNIDLNRAFVEACKAGGLPGNAYSWNRLLLRARKAGKLPRSKRANPRVSFAQMDDYSFASEIAMRIMELEYRLTLDNVLCWPEVAIEFDRIAETFAPASSSFELRWAALAIRKRASTSRSLAKKQAIKEWENKKLPPSKELRYFYSKRFEEKRGVYIVRNPEGDLYIGECLNVRNRVKSILDSESWDHLHPESLRLIPQDSQMHVLQTALVNRSDPLLNTQLLRV